jgi:hypothetical protein
MVQRYGGSNLFVLVAVVWSVCGGCSASREDAQRSAAQAAAEADPRSNEVPPARWPRFPLLPDGRFPIAAWVAPPVRETNDERYAEYAAAGFTVALFALEDRFEEASNRLRLEVAARHGIHVIPRDGRVHPDEADLPGWRADIESLVVDYGAYPALLGYFLADEPARKTFRSLGILTRHFAARDSLHPTYVNLYGLSPSGHGYDGMPYSRWLESFLDEVRPSFFSIDHYTLLEERDSPQLSASLDSTAQVAVRRGVPFWSILQLTPHLKFRPLGESELRYQANLSLAHGARGIVWFTYWSPNPNEEYRYRSGPISYEGRRNPSYDLVARVNAEVQALGQEMSPLAWRETRHSGRLPMGGRGLSGAEWIRALAGADAAIGFFAGQGGRQYALVVNRDYRRQTEARIEASGPLERWTAKASTYVPMGPEVTIKLQPGGTVLLREAAE